MAAGTASKEGRAMNKDDAPPPAEAATEVGQDESNFYGLEFWKLEVIDALIFAIGLVACAGAVVLVFGGGAA